VAFNCTPYAGFEFVYPDDFLPSITALADFELGPGEVRVVKARWPAALVPPEGTHACLLAAAIARNDHPARGAHVWEHNNLAQRNTTVVDLVAGDWIVLPFVVFNRRRRRFPWFELVVVRPKGLESLRSELLDPRGTRRVEPVLERLDCGGAHRAADGLDYGPWTSRNPNSRVAARFGEARAKAFANGPRAGLTIRLPFDERRVLGWRVWVPEGTPAGSSFLVHLVKRNRPGIKPQGGLTVQIRVTERA
jgi:hypothetical protein